jgi:hypothetical protein
MIRQLAWAIGVRVYEWWTETDKPRLEEIRARLAIVIAEGKDVDPSRRSV